MIKTTDKAYAAGYFDGDGCFHLSKPRKKFISSIVIVSTDEKVLIWFRNIWQGTLSQAKKIPNQKIVYRLVLKKQVSMYMTQDIKDYLVEKQDECHVYLKFISTDNTTEKIKYIEELRYIKNFTNRVYKELKEEFERIRDTIQPTEDDFAYLAGFIDAECCLAIQKNKPKNNPNHTYKIILSCNNTKAPVFKWLLQRFGGRIYFIERTIKYPNYNNQLKWVISAKKLSKILNKIYPFLKYKKPVCEELMKFYETTIPIGISRKTKVFQTMYSKILEERERIVHKVHQLNLKGNK